MIDWAIPTNLFSTYGTNSESPLLYVLDRCPARRATRVSSSSSWWIATDSTQEFLFIFPSIIWILPVPCEEKQHNTMILPPPNFTVGMVFLVSYAEPFLLQIYAMCGIIANSSDHNTVFQ